eukprot:5073191-Heterocapsa_arctica.AAC.1
MPPFPAAGSVGKVAALTLRLLSRCCLVVGVGGQHIVYNPDTSESAHLHAGADNWDLHDHEGAQYVCSDDATHWTTDLLKLAAYEDGGGCIYIKDFSSADG